MDTRSTTTWRRSTCSSPRSASMSRRRLRRRSRLASPRRSASRGRPSARCSNGSTAEGLLERGGGRELVLTQEGTARAEQVIRRNRIVERFLTDFLDYDTAEAHEHAGRVGAAFTDEMVERLHAKLGYPGPLPARLAGRPRPGARGEPRARLPGRPRRGRQRRDRAPGRAGRRAALLVRGRGPAPGAKVEVRDIQPAAGHRKIEIGGDEQFIADRAARGLFVRREPRSPSSAVKSPLLISVRLLYAVARPAGPCL